jgi:hypothetical protein
MKLWIIMARSVNKVFDSKEKADRYVREQENKENLPNRSRFDRAIEEWEIE